MTLTSPIVIVGGVCGGVLAPPRVIFVGEPVPAPCGDGGVGSPLARYRGAELTLGMRPFVDDLWRPGMLHGAVVLSEHARTRVVRVDTARARADSAAGRPYVSSVRVCP